MLKKGRAVKVSETVKQQVETKLESTNNGSVVAQVVVNKFRF